MNLTDATESLTTRQTWMQARILLAGTTALSFANVAHGASTDAAYPVIPFAYLISGSYQTTHMTPGFTETTQETSYEPRTELGRKLVELRARGIRSGMKLLTPAEISEEMARRRGESGK